METNNILFLVINILIMIFLLISWFKLVKNQDRLLTAMDHYNLVNAADKSKENFIVDVAEFRQDYEKKIGLIKEIKDPIRKFYYTNEVAKLLGVNLLEKKAIKIEFIQGVEHDTIIGSVRYMIKIDG